MAELKPKGMTNRSPAGSDASMRPGSGSVNTNPTRSGVAKTPRTLGPRTA